MFEKSILSRFIQKKLLNNFIGIFLVLLLIILSNHFYLVIKESLLNGYLNNEIYKLITLKLLRDLPLIISLAFLVSITYTLSKIKESSELVIINSGGVSQKELLKKSILLVLIIFSINSIFNLYLSPKFNLLIEKISAEAKGRVANIFLVSGNFYEFDDGNINLYVNSIERENDNEILNNVFLHDQSQKDSPRFIFASTGIRKLNSNESNVLFLSNGKIYSILNNLGRNISSFSKLRLEIEKKNSLKFELNPQQIDTYDLFKDLLPANSKELSHRISKSIMILILIFIAFEIVKTKQRSKNNSSVLLIIILFAAYYNILIIVKSVQNFNEFDVLSLMLITHSLFILLYKFLEKKYL